MSTDKTLSRRGLFMKVGILFNGWSLRRLPYRSFDFFYPRLRADARTVI